MDYGGRVEVLRLVSQSQGKLRDVLLTHNDNASAIIENKYWKGMLLIPWANRIAYVSPLISCVFIVWYYNQEYIIMITGTPLNIVCMVCILADVLAH